MLALPKQTVAMASDLRDISEKLATMAGALGDMAKIPDLPTGVRTGLVELATETEHLLRSARERADFLAALISIQ